MMAAFASDNAYVGSMSQSACPVMSSGLTSEDRRSPRRNLGGDKVQLYPCTGGLCVTQDACGVQL